MKKGSVEKWKHFIKKNIKIDKIKEISGVYKKFNDLKEIQEKNTSL